MSDSLPPHGLQHTRPLVVHALKNAEHWCKDNFEWSVACSSPWLHQRQHWVQGKPVNGASWRKLTRVSSSNQAFPLPKGMKLCRLSSLAEREFLWTFTSKTYLLLSSFRNVSTWVSKCYLSFSASWAGWETSIWSLWLRGKGRNGQQLWRIQSGMTFCLFKHIVPFVLMV